MWIFRLPFYFAAGGEREKMFYFIQKNLLTLQTSTTVHETGFLNSQQCTGFECQIEVHEAKMLWY